MAPVDPRKIPIACVSVILSFRMKYDKMTTMMGLKAMMIPELIADDRFNP
jgi:hypothetical protein